MRFIAKVGCDSMSPMRPLRLCRHIGCNALVSSGYCEKHTVKKVYTDNRDSARDRGYKTNWDKVRALKVSRDPLCEECLRQNDITPVDIVHHIIPVVICKQVHREDLIYDLDNLKSDCRPCHGAEEADDKMWNEFARRDHLQGAAMDIIARFEKWKDGRMY